MNTELSKRAVACKGWRWMPGMAYLHRGFTYRIGSVVGSSYDDECIPDLDDPATLGCLLHIVREAWGDRTIVVSWSGVCWVCDIHSNAGGSEAEALVAALEAAP